MLTIEIKSMSLIAFLLSNPIGTCGGGPFIIMLCPSPYTFEPIRCGGWPIVPQNEQG